MKVTTYETKTASLEVNYAFNRLKGVHDTESISKVAQVIDGGKLGITTTTKPTDIQNLMEKAKELSAFGPKVSYDIPCPEPHGHPEIYDERVNNLELSDLISTGDMLVGFLTSLHPHVTAEITLKRAVSHERVTNSKGLDSSWNRTAFHVMAGLNFVEGDNILNVYAGHDSTAWDFHMDLLKGEMEESFHLGRENVKIQSGNYRVLFTPMGFMSLLSPIQTCLNGRSVLRGISPYGGMIGEKVLSPNLSIINDGLLDKGVASSLYDVQGVACRKTPLIESGVLREYLLDLETAEKLQRQPIGTGGLYGIAPNNIVVLPGESSLEDMISGMDKGIVIDGTMGAWAGNPYGGQVSGNISLGYFVQNGKKVGRVKDCMFSLNVFSHLKDNLMALSKENKSFGGMVLPYALVDGVSISAKS